jgi:hypothetical protein
MKEVQYPLSDTQRKFIYSKLYDMLNGYYVKGNNSYTTLMGYTLGMRDSLSLLDTILYRNYYTPMDKELLNEIRSMYISLTLTNK